MARTHDLRGVNPETDYEKSDMSLRAIGLAALGVLALLVAGPVALHVFDTAVPEDAPRGPTVLPPVPRLETEPAADLATLRASEDKRLDSYGWVDRQKGIVHIPIAEAMKRLAAEGIDGFPRSGQ